MHAKKILLLIGLCTVFTLLFLFSYNNITGLFVSSSQKTNIYYNEEGYPIQEIVIYPDGIMEINYEWYDDGLKSLKIYTKDNFGEITSESYITRNKDQWIDYLDNIEAKAKERKLSRFGQKVRKFLISSRLRKA